jgi:predicted PhzF superfamily epimerase YddE/YHI9
VDAFAKRRYSGNPAAVVLLGQGRQHWPNDDILQNIAEENNLSETAFVIEPVGAGGGAAAPDLGEWKLRWFTPRAEVDLCGHATLATAHVIFTRVPSMSPAKTITFDTRSGKLFVERLETDLSSLDEEGEDSLSLSTKREKYCMTFPVVEVADDVSVEIQERTIDVFNLKQKEEEEEEEEEEEDARPAVQVLRAGPDILVVVRDWKRVQKAQPDMSKLDELLTENSFRGSIITAETRSRSDSPSSEKTPSNDDDEIDKLDFVSRFFAPNLGIPEDPATGSAHCALSPFWARRKQLLPFDLEPSRKYASFKAKQMSKRGGYVDCELHTNSKAQLLCKLIGQCVDFLDGMIDIEEPEQINVLE